MRIGWIVVALVIAAPLLFILQTRLVQNPRVVRTLEAEPDGELARRVLILTLPSGKTIPVNYLLDVDPAGREIVYVASDFFWWRELRGERRPVEVFLRGRRRTGLALTIEGQAAHRERVFARLRPTAPRWFGVLVEIALDEEPR